MRGLSLVVALAATDRSCLPPPRRATSRRPRNPAT